MVFFRWQLPHLSNLWLPFISVCRPPPSLGVCFSPQGCWQMLNLASIHGPIVWCHTLPLLVTIDLPTTILLLDVGLKCDLLPPPHPLPHHHVATAAKLSAADAVELITASFIYHFAAQKGPRHWSNPSGLTAAQQAAFYTCNTRDTGFDREDLDLTPAPDTMPRLTACLSCDKEKTANKRCFLKQGLLELVTSYIYLPMPSSYP